MSWYRPFKFDSTFDTEKRKQKAVRNKKTQVFVPSIVRAYCTRESVFYVYRESVFYAYRLVRAYCTRESVFYVYRESVFYAYRLVRAYCTRESVFYVFFHAYFFDVCFAMFFLFYFFYVASSGTSRRCSSGMGCKAFAGCAASVLLLYSIYC
jgi:hypothetical protein